MKLYLQIVYFHFKYPKENETNKLKLYRHGTKNKPNLFIKVIPDLLQ